MQHLLNFMDRNDPECLIAGNSASLSQVYSNFNARQRRALCPSRLQQFQLTTLNRELNLLHVAKSTLQGFNRCAQVVIDPWPYPFETRGF